MAPPRKNQIERVGEAARQPCLHPLAGRRAGRQRVGGQRVVSGGWSGSGMVVAGWSGMALVLLIGTIATIDTS